MEQVFGHVSSYVGYVYPNETDIPWTELIVIYPYITGLVAGAFVISSLHHVFGLNQFRAVSKFALLTALCFMFFAPVPLLFHLGQPTQALNAVITPHWTSAMAAFGYVAAFYVCLLLLEVWFAFREDIVARSKTTKGVLGKAYKILTLGSDDVSPAALATDHKIARILAMIGIPGACGLHGYVGFVYGSLKTREWWSSDLMSPIFLVSAVVSGVGLLIVLYVVTSKVRKITPDHDAMVGLTQVFWASLVIVLVFEGLELLEMFYKAREGIETVHALITGPIWAGMSIQWGLSVISLVILSALMILKPKGKVLVNWLFFCGLAMMVAVLAMRWNVVIGGQELSKTMKGLLTYHPKIVGRESLLTVLLLFISPFITLYLATQFLPPWFDKKSHPHGAVAH
ncbi:MAG: NrfD/PsrC family molybdoenzyme membrane anchor subunit [Gallionellaceae bacterium]|jgi:Ni/Fe-hydrogenase subunit HybB-like protein